MALIDKDSFIIIGLSSLIDRYGEGWAAEVLSSYESVYDSATESYLKEKAIDMERRDLSRTYIALSISEPKVLGYITLSIKCMTVPKENILSGKVLKRMNIEESTGVAQSYLLGQLSRSADAPKGLGGMLLDLAFDKLGEAKSLVGCRMIRLDCHDELIPYYENHGFRPIRENKAGTLNQMMAFI